MKNSARVLIGILFGLNIVLVAIILLLLTGVVDLGKDSDKKDNNNENVVDKDIKENNLIDDDKKYSSIISEYKEAIKDENFDDNIDKYININTIMVSYYHKHINGVFSGSMSINYVYYDINKDGNNELIVFTNSDDKNGSIIDIYTSDGNNTNTFDAGCVLGERCSATIYDNGIIYFYGSGGATVHGLTFYKIGNDGYTFEKEKEFDVEVNNGVYSAELNGVKTEFKSDDEVIKSIVNSASKVDMFSLNYKEIK